MAGLGEFHWGNTTGLKENVPYCINFPLRGFNCIISVNGSAVKAMAFSETYLIVSCRQVLEMEWFKGFKHIVGICYYIALEKLQFIL